MLPASPGRRIALVLVGISFWVALMHLRLPLSARSRIDRWFPPYFYVFASFF